VFYFALTNKTENNALSTQHCRWWWRHRKHWRMSGSAKKQTRRGSLTSAILPNTNVLCQVIGILEPEKRKVGQSAMTILRGVQRHIWRLLPTSLRAARWRHCSYSSLRDMGF